MKSRFIKAFGAGAATVCILYGTIMNSYRNAVSDNDSSNKTTVSSTLSDTSDTSLSANSTVDTSSTSNTESNSTDTSTTPSTSTTEETQITDSTTTSDSSEEEISETETTTEDIPSLSKYLADLTCDGCGRNCSLLNPRCHTGSQKAETATVEYYEEYNVESDS